MRKWTKKIFEKNITLKIISLVLAVFVWAYIMIVLNPPIETTIRVPIQIINQLSLDDLGYSIVSQSADVTTVRVQGARNVISRLTTNDITATVNLAYIDTVGTRSLPVNISVLVSNVTILNSNPLAIDITVDETITVRQTIRPVITGELRDNFIMGSVLMEPNFVNITGPSVLVNDITATVFIPVEGRTSDIDELTEITFGSASGRDIHLDLLEFSVMRTDVFVEITGVRTVPIVPNLPEDIMNDIELGAYTLSVVPETITLFGDAEILNEIDEVSTTLAYGEFWDNMGLVSIIVPDGVHLRAEVGEISVVLEPVGELEESEGEEAESNI